jgi:putative tryptophan/tyrosine transport system substrate-binding protein
MPPRSRPDGDVMRRRDVLALLGAPAALAMLTPAHAQQPVVPHIGLVSIGADPTNPVIFAPFLQQMRALGYLDGHNIQFEKRFAGGHDERIGGFMADLVQREVQAIVVTGQRETEAAHKATTSIPIVTIVHPDPIGMGLAQSLARPGANVTGLTAMETAELHGKRMELLKQAVPGLQTVGVLVSNGRADYKRDTAWFAALDGVARPLGLSLDHVGFEADTVDAAISAALGRGTQALICLADGVVIARRVDIAETALRLKLPTISAQRPNVDAGGLMSYSGRIADMSRRAAFFVDRILKGAKPADMPIEQPTTFELIVNLKTAKALGLTLPPAVLALADEVIE